MAYDTLLIYCLVAFFYIISPGPAIFLAVYNGAVNGTKPVMFSALGNVIGLMVLSSLSISGLSTLLLTSATLFMTVKLIGGAYLVYLGFKQIYASNSKQLQNSYLQKKTTRNLFSYFKEGLLLAISNPKPIIFFAALFPQFINTQQPLLIQFSLMTLIFMLFSFLSLSTYGYLSQRAKGFLATNQHLKWFHRISGGLFVAMGISLVQVKYAS